MASKLHCDRCNCVIEKSAAEIPLPVTYRITHKAAEGHPAEALPSMEFFPLDIYVVLKRKEYDNEARPLRSRYSNLDVIQQCYDVCPQCLATLLMLAIVERYGHHVAGSALHSTLFCEPGASK